LQQISEGSMVFFESVQFLGWQFEVFAE